MSSKKGFTLIELVLVIAVIAILAAVVAPRFMKQMPKAQDSATKANLQNMRTALDVYVAEGKPWPRTVGELNTALRTTMRSIPYESVNRNKTKNNDFRYGYNGAGGWYYRRVANSTDYEIRLNVAGIDSSGTENYYFY